MSARMWINYDLQYDVKQGKDVYTRRDVGAINVDKIQAMEVTGNAFYINISENHYLRFEYEYPEIIFHSFLMALTGQFAHGVDIEGLGSIKAFYLDNLNQLK